MNSDIVITEREENQLTRKSCDAIYAWCGRDI